MPPIRCRSGAGTRTSVVTARAIRPGMRLRGRMRRERAVAKVGTDAGQRHVVYVCQGVRV